MFGHAGCDGQDVRVENDVGGREVEFLHQDVVSAGSNLHAALVVGGLAFFVKEHHDDGGTQALNGERMFDKRLFAHLQRDGVHNALALDALETRLDDFESGRVHHDGHAAHGRVGCNQVQESLHFGGSVEQAVVHVHVNHVGAVFDLLACDVERFVVILLVDEPQELLGACHVAAFAYLHEVFGVATVGAVARAHLFLEQRFQTGEAEERARCIFRCGLATFVIGRQGVEHLAHRSDVFRSRTAAAANHVHQLVVQIDAHESHHVFGRVVITAELVRQPRIRVARNIAGRDFAHAAQVRHHAVGTEAAVEADGERVHVHHAHGECFNRLARKRTARGVAHRHREHDFDWLEVRGFVAGFGSTCFHHLGECTGGGLRV